MLMKLLGIACAIAATGTVLVYGFGLQVQRPITPLEAAQPVPPTTPKAKPVVAAAPVHAPERLPDETLEAAPTKMTEKPVEIAQMDSGKVAVTPSSLPLETIEVVAEPDVSVAEGLEAAAEQVFVFWQPFRSRGSAQGFAQGLSARAEVPISVISEDTDMGRQYRVVLPYDSEAQRLERLARLESATRLKMGE